ncbi:MAG: hypothetical protein WCX82_01010 [archaeon]|jgi:hypothetical protein
MPSRPTFKQQIENCHGRIKHEVFGYKKARENFIEKTRDADENKVSYDEKGKYLTGKYTEIHTHQCNPKLNFESTPSGHDLFGWIDDYLVTNGKKHTAVVSSTHFKNGEEFGRVHIFIKKDAFVKQLANIIYDCYCEFMLRNGRVPNKKENFNAELFFSQETGKIKTYLQKRTESDFDFKKRLANSKTKDLKEVFKDIEKTWGIKIRPFSHPGHAFDYKRGTFY